MTALGLLARPALTPMRGTALSIALGGEGVPTVAPLDFAMGERPILTDVATPPDRVLVLSPAQGPETEGASQRHVAFVSSALRYPLRPRPDVLLVA
jgi:hypothetical protein